MQRLKLISATVAVFLLTLAVTNSYAALIEEVTGTVELRRIGQNIYKEALTGQTVATGDTLRTGDDGKAVIKLPDGSTINFSEKTEFILGKELKGEKPNIIGTILRGVARAVLEKRAGSYIKTPTGSIGIRGTDITVKHNGEAGFYFLDEGNVGIEINGNSAQLTAGQMTASYSKRKPLPPFTFTKSSGLAKARGKLAELTSMEVPPSLQDHAQLNEILARWIINYAHYLAESGKHEDAETALLIAEELTGRQDVKGEILLQIGGLYFYHLNDVNGALRSYRRIIREYNETPCYENALYGAIRCFSLLKQQDKAKEFARAYKEKFPEGKYIQGIEALLR